MAGEKGTAAGATERHLRGARQAFDGQGGLDVRLGKHGKDGRGAPERRVEDEEEVAPLPAVRAAGEGDCRRVGV